LLIKHFLEGFSEVVVELVTVLILTVFYS